MWSRSIQIANFLSPNLFSKRCCILLNTSTTFISSNTLNHASIIKLNTHSSDNCNVHCGIEENARHRKKVISRALEAYLNDVKNYNEMMAKEKAEFELGKRHLANIMGLDPLSITQNDIDKAVEYLFPSGLTDKKALPVMKPPEEILPKMRQIEFDAEGRPENLLFYTLSPNFYQFLSEIGRKIEKLLNRQHTSAQGTTENQKIILVGTEWITKEALSERIKEMISDEMYAQFIIALEFLASLPFAHEESEFIFRFRKSISGDEKRILFGPEVPPVKLIDGLVRQAESDVRIKKTTGKVVVRSEGSGKYTVEGHGLDNFRSLQAREIFLAPLIVASLLGKVDVFATDIKGPGGTSVVPRLVRHGVALGCAALFPESFEKLRLAGLLTQDPRRRERKKINQPGARAKWIWKKR